jgi:transcriptional regulator with XRE-family HTH domain
MISTEYTMCDKMLSMDNFGRWLLQELEDRKMSQSELSRLSGLSRGTLSNLISGTRGRGPDSIEAIARAFKMPPEQVFRVAGLLPPKADADEWIEEQAHKMSLLTPGKRQMAERLIDALLEEDKPVPTVRKTAKAKTS